MTLDQVIQAERQAIVTESLLPTGITGSGAPMLAYSAVEDPEMLATTPSGLRTRFPVMIESLPGRPRRDTFVQICPKLDYRFLWARGDNEQYRRDYLSSPPANGRWIGLFAWDEGCGGKHAGKIDADS